MDTTSIILVIFSVLLILGTIWLFMWFVQRKNPPKVSRTEEKKEQIERPNPGEIEDPLN